MGSRDKPETRRYGVIPMVAMSISKRIGRFALQDPGEGDGDAVHFCSTCAFGEICLPGGYDKQTLQELHFLVDANVDRLYARPLERILAHPNLILIEAKEENKSLQSIIPVFDQLFSNKVRRNQVRVAIGGGIVQAITCFSASTLLLVWTCRFMPTTLL